jgi:hypothetical protein
MMRLRIAALAALIPAMAWAQPDVPPNAHGFVHIRVADMWAHGMMKSARDMVDAAGPKAYAAWLKQVYPNPGEIDTATLLVLPGKNPQGPPDVIVAVNFKTAPDAAKMQKLYLPEAKASVVNGTAVMTDADRDISVSMTAGGKTLIAGPKNSVAAWLAKAPTSGANPFAEAIAAASSKAITLGVNVKSLPIPPKAYEELPPDLRPLAMVQMATLTFDLGAADPVLKLDAKYDSPAAVADAEKALKAAIMMGKQALKQPRSEMEAKLFAEEAKGPQSLEKMAEVSMALVAIGGLNQVEALMDNLPITKANTSLIASVAIPKEAMQFMGVYSGVMVGLLLPAVQKVRMAASSSVSMNNMKQIGLALYNMHDTYGKMPGSAICDKAGKPLLSWRVAILPYIEQDNVYRQFKLDEPWDSPANKRLIAMMPKIYASPRYELKEGMTCYKVFNGPEAMFTLKEGKTFARISDGTSNTIMAVEAGDPVIWTKPEDFEFDSKKNLPKMTLPGGLKDITVLMGDGSVRRANLDKVSADTWKILIGAADGMVTPNDWYGDNAPAPMQYRTVPKPPTASGGAPPLESKKK